MARKNPDGGYIISASEVGTFTVCPESWRLKVMNRTPVEPTPRKDRGEKLHQQWAANIDETLYLIKQIKNVLLLLGFALMIYLVSAGW
jgi:hypothetical protein